MNGVELIRAERQRQIEVEGYDAEHDADHWQELASAAAAYAATFGDANVDVPEVFWPWDFDVWKPTPDDPVRQLVKAGALIAAAIDAAITEQEAKDPAVRLDGERQLIRDWVMSPDCVGRLDDAVRQNWPVYDSSVPAGYRGGPFDMNASEYVSMLLRALIEDSSSESSLAPGTEVEK